jgi:hypothetical protein
MLLMIFLAAILVVLYRYNMRLAAFYDARADALRLADKLPDLRFDELVTSLSPDSIDFGRMPKSPADQVVALAREIISAGKQLKP